MRYIIHILFISVFALSSSTRVSWGKMVLLFIIIIIQIKGNRPKEEVFTQIDTALSEMLQQRNTDPSSLLSWIILGTDLRKCFEQIITALTEQLQQREHCSKILSWMILVTDLTSGKYIPSSHLSHSIDTSCIAIKDLSVSIKMNRWSYVLYTWILRNVLSSALYTIDLLKVTHCVILLQSWRMTFVFYWHWQWWYKMLHYFSATFFPSNLY